MVGAVGRLRCALCPETRDPAGEQTACMCSAVQAASAACTRHVRSCLRCIGAPVDAWPSAYVPHLTTSDGTAKIQLIITTLSQTSLK
jgi:hypothetical protein